MVIKALEQTYKSPVLFIRRTIACVKSYLVSVSPSPSTPVTSLRSNFQSFQSPRRMTLMFLLFLILRITSHLYYIPNRHRPLS